MAQPTWDHRTYSKKKFVKVEQLEASENKTYTPEKGKAFGPVVVDVEGGGGGSMATVYIMSQNYSEDVFPYNFTNGTEIYTGQKISGEASIDDYSYNLYAFSCHAGDLIYLANDATGMGEIGYFNDIESLIEGYPFAYGDIYRYTGPLEANTAAIAISDDVGVTGIVLDDVIVPNLLFERTEDSDPLFPDIYINGGQVSMPAEANAGDTISVRGTGVTKVWYKVGDGELVEVSYVIDRGYEFSMPDTDEKVTIVVKINFVG